MNNKAERDASRAELDQALGPIEITVEELAGAADEAALERLLVNVENFRRDAVSAGISSPSEQLVERALRNQDSLSEVRKRKGIKPDSSRTSIGPTLALSDYGVVDNTQDEPLSAIRVAINDAFGDVVADDDFLSKL